MKIENTTLEKNYNKAVNLILCDDHESALSIIDDLYKKDPGYKDLYAKFGGIFREQREWKQASEWMKKDYKQGRMSWGWKLRYSEVLAELGREEDALKLIDRVYEEVPEATDGYARLGWRYTRNKDWSRAQELMCKDEVEDRMSPVWRVHYAQVLYRQGEEAHAVAQIEEAYEQNADQNDGFSRLGGICREQREWLRAAEWMETDYKQGRMSWGWKLRYSEVLAELGREEDALKLIDRVYEEVPEATDGYARLGWRYTRDKDWSRAQELMGKDEIQARISPVWRVNYAQVLYRQGEEALAIAQIEEAYEQNVDQKNGFSRLGDICREKSEWMKASEWMKRDYSQGRMSSWKMFSYAEILLEVENDNDAVRLIEEVYDREPHFSNGYARLAWRKWLKGDYVRAEILMNNDFMSKKISIKWVIRYARMKLYGGKKDILFYLLNILDNKHELINDTTEICEISRLCFESGMYEKAQNILRNESRYSRSDNKIIFMELQYQFTALSRWNYFALSDEVHLVDSGEKSELIRKALYVTYLCLKTCADKEKDRLKKDLSGMLLFLRDYDFYEFIKLNKKIGRKNIIIKSVCDIAIRDGVRRGSKHCDEIDELETRGWDLSDIFYLYDVMIWTGNLKCAGKTWKIAVNNAMKINGDNSRNDANVKRKLKSLISYGSVDDAEKLCCELPPNYKASNEEINAYVKFMNGGISSSRKYYENRVRKNKKKYWSYLEGKNIAIVGPAGELDNVDQINKNEVIISPQYTGEVIGVSGVNVNVSYYDWRMVSYWGEEKFKRIIKDLDHYVYNSMSYWSPRFLDDEKKGISSQILNNTNMIYKMPNAIQRIVYDVLHGHPKKVTIYNVNFYTGKAPYIKGYAGIDKYSDFYNIPIMKKVSWAHDIISQFTYMKTLWEKNIIHFDKVGEEVMGLTIDEYIERLELIHGKTSV